MIRARRPAALTFSDATPAAPPALTIDAAVAGPPAYSNIISLTALLPRKLELCAGSPAKDRSWKSVYCCLEGTLLSIYKDNRSFVKRMRVKSQVSAPSRPLSLHVHAQGYAPTYEDLAAAYAVPGDNKTPLSPCPAPSTGLLTPVLPSPMNHRFLTSPVCTQNGYLASPARNSHDGSSFGSPFNPRNSTAYSISSVSLLYPPASPAVLEPPRISRLPTDMDSHITSSTLIRQYSLHGAECGVASDYAKRAHVLRLRIEDEQFLLQLPDLQTNVLWIESIQTAINLALDLDQRPMPPHRPFATAEF